MALLGICSDLLLAVKAAFHSSNFLMFSLAKKHDVFYMEEGPKEEPSI